MNGKSDEHIDQWVRQSLRDLPDIPPAGSAFSRERLWEQLSPQLPTTRRHHNWVWRAAAACLAGLLAGWFWLNHALPTSPEVAHHSLPTVTQAIGPQKVNGEQQTALIGRAYTRRSASRQPDLSRGSHPEGKASQPDDAYQPTDSLVVVHQVPAPPESVAGVVPVDAETGKPPSKPAVVPRRRFRVVHINELMTEDEVRPKPHRTDHFVRLGSGQDKPASDEPTPAILLPVVIN